MADANQTDLTEAIRVSRTPQDSWRSLVDGLAAMGLDQINYAFLDMEAHGRVQARAEPFMATMRADWIERYVEQKYDLVDDLVDHVKHGTFAPRLYRFDRVHDFAAPVYAHEAREAGLNAGLVIPLCGDPAQMRVTAGIMFGSSLATHEGERILTENATALTAIAHVFHTCMIGEFKRQQAGARPLSPRERDCLQLAARGMRTAQIAHKLCVAETTVGFHLANARSKLGAKSVIEAVARALKFQQISLD